MINGLNMVVVMTTCYRDKLHMLTEVHGENKTGVFHFLVETIVRRYRVNIIRTLPEISLQCQPEIRLTATTFKGRSNQVRSCTHRLFTRAYSQRLLTSLIYEFQLFIVTVGFASLTNDRDIIILFCSCGHTLDNCVARNFCEF